MATKAPTIDRLLQAQALAGEGNFTAAIKILDALLHENAANREAHSLLGFVLLFSGDAPAALATADELTARYPNFPDGHALRGLALGKLRRPDEALVASERVARLVPGSALARSALADALREMGRISESEQQYRVAGRLGAGGVSHLQGLGATLALLGRAAEAEAAFAAAARIEPNDYSTHVNQAYAWLAAGDFRRGWPKYEWRLREPNHQTQNLERLAPRWIGQRLAGKRLLVHAEQSNGDAIQFSRYLTLETKVNVDVTLQIDLPVRDLIADSFPQVTVVRQLDAAHEPFDYQIPLLSLPFAHATRLETVPTNVPYLKPASDRIAKWQTRIGAHGLKVGISWQGNPGYQRDFHRSIPLRLFTELSSIPNVRLISLQSIRGLDQFADLPSSAKVERLGEEVENNPDSFREIAAATMALDLLIVSDSAPAHVGGALAVPTWVALTRYPDWRWLSDRDDSPWYPTMRLFRQKTIGDWASVFAVIADALQSGLAFR